ncbi:thioredoxin-dependent thiol peroxidase [[Clostridium] colinum]|uniref:thioredoxin-dependent thiol peroxidase n=1 Tax=[Clostridium] colinum TaxID=36835 RepID=UPI0020241048|nr:thioredoxin-dependent thiol peroxidase [[Clostridium] colinum]
MLNVGDKAPNFTLPDKDGKEVSLSDFLGKKVVLYFYPKDNTPGCSKQACGFSENLEQFNDNNTVIIGISKDSQKSHQNFIAKYNLNIILLSDTERKVIEDYGVWQEKKLYGKVSMGVVRTTFIIDELGNIEKIYDKVKASENPKETLEYIKSNK